jgi:hypothetical protein
MAFPQSLDYNQVNLIVDEFLDILDKRLENFLKCFHRDNSTLAIAFKGNQNPRKLQGEELAHSTSGSWLLYY